MKYKQFIPNCDRGFTITELMVASTLGLLIMGLTLASSISSRTLMVTDRVRTHLNEDLRGTIDLMGSQLRIAGEGFGGRFPAILIENGVDGASDELILRRKTLNEVLKVCVSLSSGSGDPLIFADPSLMLNGCGYDENTIKYDAWSQLRDGGTVLAYIYDGVSKGEFFTYDGEEDTTNSYAITSADSWQNEYPVNSAAYVMEEWRFRVRNSLLELVIDNDEQNPLNVAYNIEDFQVTALMNDGSELTELKETDDWSMLAAVKFELTAEEEVKGESIERTMTGEYFPRNVLSN